jgi:hypothetical protein
MCYSAPFIGRNIDPLRRGGLAWVVRCSAPYVAGAVGVIGIAAVLVQAKD